MKEEKFPNTRKPSHGQVCGEFWDLRAQHNWEENKNKKSTDYVPNRNSQWRSSPDTHVCHQQVGLNREAKGCMLRVRTGPECPEENLRNLM